MRPTTRSTRASGSFPKTWPRPWKLACRPPSNALPRPRRTGATYWVGLHRLRRPRRGQGGSSRPPCSRYGTRRYRRCSDGASYGVVDGFCATTAPGRKLPKDTAARSRSQCGGTSWRIPTKPSSARRAGVQQSLLDRPQSSTTTRCEARHGNACFRRLAPLAHGSAHSRSVKPFPGTAAYLMQP